MKNEDKIVELLSELVQKQDAIVGEITGLRADVSGLKEEQKKTNTILSKHEKIMNKHERDLLKIIELLEQDVPKFDKVVKIEQLPEDRFIIRKLPSEKA